ncbi:Protein DOG1-like 3 [Hirschfeldia incana]|nr:Protein DOG1-like 3 [Hirschfeldia incana]
MASTSSSSYGIEHLQKECYYEWMSLQAKHIVDLKEALMSQRSNAYNHHKLEELVGKIVNNFQKYSEKRSELTDRSCSSYLAPSWNSYLEKSLLWMGGCRPSSFIRIIYALCGSHAEAHFSQYFHMDENVDCGDDSDSSMSDLTATQLEKINDLHIKVIAEEDMITKKCANMQEDFADMPVAVTALLRDSVEDDVAVKDALDKHEECMGVLMAEADKLRLETLRRIVEVLTPVQAAEFLLSGKRLHMSLHEWGRAREERLHGCVHVRMQQQQAAEPGSQRDRPLVDM